MLTLRKKGLAARQSASSRNTKLSSDFPRTVPQFVANCLVFVMVYLTFAGNCPVFISNCRELSRISCRSCCILSEQFRICRDCLAFSGNCATFAGNRPAFTSNCPEFTSMVPHLPRIFSHLPRIVPHLTRIVFCICFELPNIYRDLSRSYLDSPALVTICLTFARTCPEFAGIVLYFRKLSHICREQSRKIVSTPKSGHFTINRV